MPRETVNALDRGRDTEGNEFMTPLPSVEVGWSPYPTGGVQVGLQTGIQSDGQRHLVDYLYGDHAVLIGDHLRQTLLGAVQDSSHEKDLRQALVPFTDADLGRAVLDAVTVAEAAVSTGWYTHLDRHGVNRLIRLLKKAGRAAWGSDEW